MLAIDADNAAAGWRVMADRNTERADLFMPMPDEHALRQFEIEALRQITDNLKRLNDGQAEQGKVLHSIDNRLTRIESNSVSADVEKLKAKVDELERDRDRRDGTLAATSWVFRNWPGVVGWFGGIITLVAVILKANGKL